MPQRISITASSGQKGAEKSEAGTLLRPRFVGQSITLTRPVRGCIPERGHPGFDGGSGKPGPIQTAQRQSQEPSPSSIQTGSGIMSGCSSTGRLARLALVPEG
jgi:hypothetical protein